MGGLRAERTDQALDRSPFNARQPFSSAQPPSFVWGCHIVHLARRNCPERVRRLIFFRSGDPRTYRDVWILFSNFISTFGFGIAQTSSQCCQVSLDALDCQDALPILLTTPSKPRNFQVSPFFEVHLDVWILALRRKHLNFPRFPLMRWTARAPANCWIFNIGCPPDSPNKLHQNHWVSRFLHPNMPDKNPTPKFNKCTAFPLVFFYWYRWNVPHSTWVWSLPHPPGARFLRPAAPGDPHDVTIMGAKPAV